MLGYRRRPILLLSAVAALVAFGVTVEWIVSGFDEGLAFAIAFGLASLLLIVASFRRGALLVAVALAALVVGELEPLGGVVASQIVKQPPSFGAVVPLLAGTLAIAGAITALIVGRSSVHS